METTGRQCFTGVVTVFPPAGVGAVLGQIQPRDGGPIPLRQVVGPAGGPVSLNSVNGRTATVCGHFVSDQTGIVLNVTRVTPRSGIDPLLLVLVLLLAFGLLR